MNFALTSAFNKAIAISVNIWSTKASSTTGALFNFYNAALIDFPSSASTIL